MEDRIVRFIAALRAGGVRVSLAESADAFKAVEHLGIQDRDTVRLSLRATLVKDASGIPTFEELTVNVPVRASFPRTCPRKKRRCWPRPCAWPMNSCANSWKSCCAASS